MLTPLTLFLGYLLLGAVAYGPLLYGASEFCFDDRFVLISLREWHRKSVRAFWREFAWPGFLMHGRWTWWLILRSEALLVGLRRRGWVVIGVACHAVNATLVAVLAHRLGLPWSAAGTAGALLTVHPMAVLSVGLLAGSPSLYVLMAVLGGALAVVAGHLWVALALGVAATRLKSDGWAYWPQVGGIWFLT